MAPIILRYTNIKSSLIQDGVRVGSAGIRIPQSFRFHLSSNFVPLKFLLILDSRVSVSASQAHITTSGTSHQTCLQPDHAILIAPPAFLIAMSHPESPTIPSRLRPIRPFRTKLSNLLTNDLESMVTPTSRDSLDFYAVSLELLCLLQLEKPRPNVSCFVSIP